jgi:DNA-binding NtrC family response regulator
MSLGQIKTTCEKRSKIRVLIVDDEEDLTWSIVRRLSRDSKNLELICANSGIQAINLLKRHPIDLLVTDLRMPGMSGQDLIRQVRSEYPCMKIILMTAFSSPEIKDFVGHFQVTGYMEKPFEMDDLRKLIYVHCLGENRIHEGRLDHSQS